MTPSWMVVLFVAISAGSSPTIYSASLIRYLDDKHQGTFDCWIYRLTKNPLENNTLDELIPKLSSIPIRVLYSADKAEFDRHPGVLLIFCDNWTQTLLMTLYHFLEKASFRASLNIVVFYQQLEVDTLALIQTAFTVSNLINVIYIRTDRLEVHYYLFYRDEFVSADKEIPHEGLFLDQTKNLAGRPIQLSIGYISHEVLVMKSARILNGRVYEWVLNTVKHVNGTIKLHVVNDGHNLFTLNSTDSFDFCLNSMSYPEFRKSFLLSAYPDNQLIAAPAGRRYEVYEVFFMPLKLELWIFMIVLAGIFNILTVIFPNRYQNDILDTAVFGFERQNLHQASRLEKFTIFPLVVLYFFIFSAYEAKITAFMTNAPYSANPRTFEDLLESGITINVTTENLLGMQGDPRFKRVFRYNPEVPVMKYHPGTGYIASSIDIQQGILDPENFDVRTKRSKLVILDRFAMGIFVKFFFVGLRNPLEGRFQRTELAFYEAGLMDFWTRSLFRNYYGMKYANIVADFNGPDDETLGMEQLSPIFVGLFVGLGSAAVIFIGEIWVYLVKK